MPDLIEQDVEVVGLNFRTSENERKLLDKRLRSTPIKVKLAREPDNRFDDNAITVTLPGTLAGSLKGKHIGYLSREVASVLSPRIDAGTARIVTGTLLMLHPSNNLHTGDLRLVIAKNLGK